MRFGIGKNEECHTLEEVGKEFGVTRDRIRQIEAKVLAKLGGENIEILPFIWGRQPYRCLCGKYKKKRYVGIICDKCGVVCRPREEISKILVEKNFEI